MGILVGDRFEYIELKNISEIVPSTTLLLVDKLGIKSGKVRLCQGNLLDKLASRLTLLGFEVERVRIEGKLQEKLDFAYRLTLKNAGLPEHLLDILYDYHQFPGALSAWVFLNPKERMHLLSSVPPRRGVRLEDKRNRSKTICFECRKPIFPGETKAVVVVTNGGKVMCKKQVHGSCVNIN